MSVNKVIVIGNLGANPDIRALPSGPNVANFSLATTERFYNLAQTLEAGRAVNRALTSLRDRLQAKGL